MSGYKNRIKRLRFFDSGNNRCPICLCEFKRTDVEKGTKVTLEHVPPKTLGGSPLCLTCKTCNNKASVIEQHAFKMLKARKEWTEHKGVPIVVNIGGFKKKSRYFPNEINASFPSQIKHLRGGKIDIGSIPHNVHLDKNLGFSLNIPQRDDFEFVSMIKSAYLTIFSLLGVNGYRFAENEGLKLVREQIMNPYSKILKPGFIGTLNLDCKDYHSLQENVVFLWHAKPNFWVVPMWRDNLAVILPCGWDKL